MKELKTVATMLGSMLTKEEVEEFMREAHVVSFTLYQVITVTLSSGWQWKT